MKSLSILAALAATTFATPVMAQTYDAFRDFQGATPQTDSTNGRFIYGEANPSSPNDSGTFFAANTNCFIDGSTCLQAQANHDVPGVAKGGLPPFQYGSVVVPQDRLLIHPANSDNLTYAAFVAPTAGVYRLYATFNVQDVNPTGVDIFRIGTTSGGTPLTFSQVGSIGAGNPVFSDYQMVNLGAFEAIGYGVGRQGNYFNDSTGLNFSVFAGVPEPSTWALMIIGFGAIGGAMRRRPRTSVAFA